MFGKFFKAGEPIIGLVLAYLLNPVLKFVEEPTYKFFRKRVKSENCKEDGKNHRNNCVSFVFNRLCCFTNAAIVPIDCSKCF